MTLELSTIIILLRMPYPISGQDVLSELFYLTFQNCLKILPADVYLYLSISEQASIAKVIRALLSSLCLHDFIQNLYIGSTSLLAFTK
jgi:hypothetical protein